MFRVRSRVIKVRVRVWIRSKSRLQFTAMAEARFRISFMVRVIARFMISASV